MEDSKFYINVLIVEDDIYLSELIKNYLKKNKCTVTIVDRAEEAIQLISENYYDLFIIDLQLAGVVDGMKLLQYIKFELKLDSQVIMVSGNLTIKSAIECIRLGAYDLFEKPFALSKLNEIIDSLTEKKIIKRIPLNVVGVYKIPYTDELNKNYNILVIDDEEDVRMLVSIILQDLNFNVFIAEDVAAAEKILKKTRPDLIILDVMLPGEDGYSFGKRLKADERYFDIPILMFSAKNTADDIKKGIDICADDYLPKPFNNKILISKIKALLRMKNIVDEMKVYTNSLLQKIEKQDILRKNLSKETLFISQLNQTLELADRAILIKQYLTDILDFELFSLFLLDGNELKILSHNHNEIPSIIKLSELKKSPMLKAIETKKPVLIEDYKKSEFYNSEIARAKYKKKSSLIYPLVIHNKVIGVLNMNNKLSGEFDILFVEYATRLIEHISNSLENCLLFQKMEELAIYDSLTQVFNRRHFF
ncbi:MAG TPA: response regulator, partial [bacterium]|nr:response regulator [bacterium]